MASDRIVILASSRKPGGRCIAGLSLSTHRLVRPVGEGSAAINRFDYGWDHYPEEFDVVKFGHSGGDGDVTQPENLLVDGEAWTFEGTIERTVALPLIEPLVEPGDVIFGNRGKAVPDHVAAEGLESSLCVVEPELLGFELTEEIKTRALFECAGREWDLALTDYRVRSRLMEQSPGVYTLDDLGFGTPARAMVLLSLATPNNGYHTKLAAAVLDFP